MRSRLEAVLQAVPGAAIAVSGGVDSMTLATLAAETLADVVMVHAVSAAVPAEATRRVKQTALERRWSLVLIEANEFENPAYRSNPVNRCFYCKTSLYSAMRLQTERPIMSGANLDDLAEYRPGLDAARLHGVRHPFVEAAFSKGDVRQLARDLGLPEIAELPSSPCLASRVETGIRIEPETLAFIHATETLMNTELAPTTVRCRVRSASVVIELDSATLAPLSTPARTWLALKIAGMHGCPALPIAFEPYRNGSAFLTGR